MITVTDLFCGAGGSGLGATAVPGVELVMAANHWPLAVETHEHNFPDTLHDCVDISQAVPRRYSRTNILWASPECANHTNAKGKKRQRQPSQVMLPYLRTNNGSTVYELYAAQQLMIESGRSSGGDSRG